MKKKCAYSVKIILEYKTINRKKELYIKSLLQLLVEIKFTIKISHEILIVNFSRKKYQIQYSKKDIFVGRHAPRNFKFQISLSINKK